MSQSIPGPKPSFAKLGNFLDLMDAPLDAISLFSQGTEAPIFRFWCGWTSHVVIKSPSLIQQVLSNSNGHFERNSEHLRPLFRRGLLTSSGERWKKHRKLMNPSFHAGAVQAMIPTVVRCTDSLFKRWETLGERKFRPSRDFSDLMMQNLSETSFGFSFDLNSEDKQKLHESLRILTFEMIRRHFSPFPYWKVWNSPQIKRAETFMLQITQEVISRGKRSFDTNTSPSHLLGSLLFALAQDQLSESDVQDELVGILIAGHETSATALSWIAAMLAKNQDVQERARAEVDRIFGKHLPNEETLENLDYVDQVIFESLRLYPAVPMSIFKTTQETQLAGYDLPAGQRISIVSHLVHRDPHLWDRPDEFDPERFSNEEFIHRSRYQYFPFLAGPHTCLGKNLALVELRIATVMLLQRFYIGSHVGTLSMHMRVSLHPKGLEIHLIPRGDLIDQLNQKELHHSIEVPARL